ncbi:MAG: hypothetical protein ABIU63_03185 [Chitinophagaceae bacterium]
MKINFAHPLLRNLLSVVLLLGSISAAVLIIYAAQAFFYRQAGAGRSAHAALHRITGITKDDVYDLSGSEGSGNGDPMKLFDEDADPANGSTVHPNSQPLPNSLMGIYYPPGKGLRIVADLHDRYKLSDFYIYDKALASDSVWLYTGEMNNWTLVAGYATGGNAAAWGWKNFSVNQVTRYVMIRFNSAKSVISEWVLYGNLQQKIAAPVIKPLPRLPAPSLREFAGTNAYDYVAPSLLQPFNQVRLYQQMDYFDTDTVNAYPNNQLSLNTWNQPPQQQLRYYADSLRQRGNHLWMSIRGLPKYLEQKGFNEKDKPVTVPGMDKEDPLSYGRHAKTFWTMAALFGGTKIDSSQLDVKGIPKFSGLGLMDRFENGNEEDGYWTQYYWTPMDYFAVSTADYDGHEGRLGKRHGIINADVHSKLMTSGMIQLDTNRVKTLYFLCRQLRKDKKFIWEGGVQYHYYSNAAPNNLQSPVRGISPEQDHLREKLEKVRAFHDRLLPGIPLILGENGYDRNQHSWQRTPMLPGYNEAQSQGIMVMRSLVAAFMSGFDGYNQYMMRSATNDENAQGPYATSGMIGGPANNVVYPVWYYWSAYVQHLGDYQPDAVLTELGPVWIYRLKNRANPAQKAFVLFSPTTNGGINKNYSLKLPEGKSQSVRIIRLSDTDPLGNVLTAQVLDGSVQLDVGESPVIVLLN